MSSNSSRLAISTMSLGRAWHHRLAPKLQMAARYGYEGIELFYEDLEYHARETCNGTEPHQLLAAANNIREMCEALHIEIICLQPLMHFEGLRDTLARSAAFERAELFFQLANALQTPIVAVPSTFLSTTETTGDFSVIVSDLQELAELAGRYNIRLAYEALAWGTHVNHWEPSWKIVQAVDRPNFGICLDTYNIAGRIFADPTSETGMTENAMAILEASLQIMAATVDTSKIFYIQVVDAEKLETPLNESHQFYDASQPSRMSWSRNCRLFYGEQDRGGYLPIQRIMHTIVNELGFQGWVSMELFNRSMSDPSPSVPREHAERGAVAWQKLQKDFNLTSLASSSSSLKLESDNHRARALL